MRAYLGTETETVSETASTLKIDGLKVSRGGKEVLHGISLEVPRGEVTTLLGPNGAGKSTMVLAVGGVLRPTGGEVSVDGTSLTKLRPEQIRAGRGRDRPRGPQAAARPDGGGEPARRHVLRSAARTPSGASSTRSSCSRTSQTRWKAVARTLSGGEQQMVVLAQALVSRPKFVLVDELSLGLAPVVVQRLIPALQEAATQGVGVLADRAVRPRRARARRRSAYVLEGGRIVYEGTAADLKAQPGEAPLRVPAARAPRRRRAARACRRRLTSSRSAAWSRAGSSGATPATGSGSARVWHDDGRMMATWFQGSCDDFIRVSREGFERGVRILHFLGGYLGRRRRRARRSRRRR